MLFLLLKLWFIFTPLLLYNNKIISLFNINIILPSGNINAIVHVCSHFIYLVKSYYLLFTIYINFNFMYYYVLYFICNQYFECKQC